MDDAQAVRSWRWFLPALLGSTALLKLLFAWRFPAFLTGDDLEIVETAAKYAVGLDYQPWVLRSLVHPLLLAFPFVKAGALAGLADPRSITLFASLPTVLFSTASVALVYELAHSWNWPDATARAAAFLYAIHWLCLGFGSTPYPRPISTCLLLAAFLLIERSAGRSTSAWPAGVLVAAAFAVRWSEAVVLLPLLGRSWWRYRSPRNLAGIAAGFAAGVLLFVGLFDALTWGAPFASLREFWRIMHEQGLASARPDPWYWYGKRILHWAGPLLLLLLVPAARDRRVRGPLAIAVMVLVLMSFSPLKSLRFTQASVPFVALAAALGWERLRDTPGWRRMLAAAALVVAVPLGLERTLSLLRDKSQSALEAAQFLHGLAPPVRTVVLEQMWAYGEKLYLGNAVSIRDVAPKRPLPAEPIEAALGGADAVALYDLDVSPDLIGLLAARGFRPCARFQANASLAVTAYLPASRPCGSAVP
jgi:hypothetical protein